MAQPDASSTKTFHIKPQPGFIICEELIEDQQASGFVISDNMSSKDSGGVIVAIGESWQEYHTDGNVITVTCPFKVGDKVIYKNYGSNRYMDFVTGKNLFFLRFHYDPTKSDIMGVYK